MNHEILTPMNGEIGIAGVPFDSDLLKFEASQVEHELLEFDLYGLFHGVEALWKSRLHGKWLSLYRGFSDLAPVLVSWIRSSYRYPSLSSRTLGEPGNQ